MTTLLLATQFPNPAEGAGGLALAMHRTREALTAAVDQLSVSEVPADTRFLLRVARWGADLRFGYPFYCVVRGARASITEAIAACRPDVLVVDGLETAAGIGDLPGLRARANRPIIFISYGPASMDALHDPHVGGGLRGRLRRLRRAANLGRLIQFERDLLRCASDVWCFAEHEQGFLQWLGASGTWVLPKWAPILHLRRQPQVGTFGFVGTVSHAVNGAGLDALVTSLSGQADASRVHLRIAGDVPHSYARRWRRHRFVTMLGPLTESELEAEIASWSAMVVPLLRWGKGYSVKVSTAMAYALPLLSTPAGVRGYALRPGQDYVEAQDEREMAAQMVAFARDPAPLLDIGFAARELASRTWRCHDAASLIRERIASVLQRSRSA